MRHDRRHDPRHSEAGGITIVVALMLLVLLTVSAVAMSRNSLREIVTSGFNRQGAMARSTADAGIEWAVYWIFADNGALAGTLPGHESAVRFTSLQTALLQDSTLAGVAKDITDPTGGTAYTPGGALQPDLTLPSPAGVTAQGFTVGLTHLGAPTPTGMSVSTTPGGFNPAAGNIPTGIPQLWAIRADAQVHQGSIVFIQAKEAWILNPI